MGIDIIANKASNVHIEPFEAKEKLCFRMSANTSDLQQNLAEHYQDILRKKNMPGISIFRNIISSKGPQRSLELLPRSSLTITAII